MHEAKHAGVIFDRQIERSGLVLFPIGFIEYPAIQRRALGAALSML